MAHGSAPGTSAVVELSDSAIEGAREIQAETAAFVEALEAACVKNRAALPSLGGNVMIAITDVGCWTLVTRGARAGLYDEATDDEVHFALHCEEWVLHELLDPECEVDLEAYADAGLFSFDGDSAVLFRLLQLAQGGGSMVGIRAGA